MSFSWNEKKAAANRRKHGISFEEAETCFRDPLGVEYDDPDPEQGEQRRIRRAHSNRWRLLVVVFVERNDGVRIISARKATNHEGEQHAQGI